MSAPEPGRRHDPSALAETELDAATAALEEVRRQAESLRAEALREQGAARREEKRRAVLERRLERAERRIVELERSVSYRIGHAIVVALKSPVLLLRWLAVSLVRLLARVVPEDTRRWVAERTPDRLRSRVRSATRTKATSATSAGARPQREPQPEEALTSAVLDAVRGRDRLVVFVVTPSDEDVRPLIDGVLTLQRAAFFLPVFVTHSDDLLPYREAGVPFEYIPAQDEWVERGMPGTWQAYFDGRLDEIRRAYDADATIVVDPCHARLDALLDRIAPLVSAHDRATS